MNVTFSHITICDDEEILIGSYAGDIDCARDLLELHRYAEEQGIRSLMITADFYHFANEDRSCESQSANDNELEYIREHWDNSEFQNDLTLLESKTFFVEYDADELCNEEEVYEDQG